MSSRLWQRLREQLSLAYGVHFGVSVFRDVVMTHLHLATSHDKHAAAAEECRTQIAKVAEGDEPITAEETTRSLRSLIGGLTMQQQKASAAVETYVHGRCACTSRGPSPTRSASTRPCWSPWTSRSPACKIAPAACSASCGPASDNKVEPSSERP